MADLGQIAQSGIDPISGSYLSAERRKALFKRSQVSSNIFGGGGALVPINKKSDPETLAIVKTQSTSITSLQGQVNALSSEVANLNKVIFIQTQTVNGVQEVVGSLRGEVTGFNDSLNNVAKAINTDSILEQNRIKQENEDQRRATELQLRAGRESILEKAIQNALIAPVQSIAEKAQSILSRLSQFFGTLLLGWLTNQGIETLRAITEDNGKKLEQIRDNVLKALGIGAATLFLLNGGFFAIAATITNLSLKIGGWLLKNTIGKFFGALGDLLRGAGNAMVSTARAGWNALTGTRVAAPAAAAAASAADDVAKAGANVADDVAKAGAKTGAKAGANVADDVAKAGLLKGAGGLFSKLFPIANIAISGYRYSQGDIPGGTLSALSALPVIGLPAIAVDVAREFGAFEGTFLGKNETQKPTQKTPPAAPTPPVKPQSPVIPQPNKPAPTVAPASIDSGRSPFVIGQEPMVPPPPPPGGAPKGAMGTFETFNIPIDFNKPPEFGKINITPTKQGEVSVKPIEANIKPPPAQTSGVPTQVNVGPAPAPTPNIIYQRVGSSAQQQSGAAPTIGPVNQVPSISASNPDNFYVLYSQVNYNVVT